MPSSQCPVCLYFGGLHARWCTPDRRARAAADEAERAAIIADLHEAAGKIHAAGLPGDSYEAGLAELFERVAARVTAGRTVTPSWPTESDLVITIARAYLRQGADQQ